MNTLGEKVPSCQRSEGSPLSEYEVPLRPPVPLCFSGLAFFELSWRQLDTQTFFAHDLDLLSFSRTSLARPFTGTLGRASRPLSPSLSLFLPLTVFPFSAFQAVCYRRARAALLCRALPRGRRRSLVCPVLGLGLTGCLGSVPHPDPALLYLGLSGYEGGRPHHVRDQRDLQPPGVPSPGSLLTVFSFLLVSSRSSCVYGTCCLWGKTYSIGFLRFCKQVCVCPKQLPGSRVAGWRPGARVCALEQQLQGAVLPLVNSGRGGRRARKSLLQAPLGPTCGVPVSCKAPRAPAPTPQAVRGAPALGCAQRDSDRHPGSV